jgi:hypothetical protein
MLDLGQWVAEYFANATFEALASAAKWAQSCNLSCIGDIASGTAEAVSDVATFMVEHPACTAAAGQTAFVGIGMIPGFGLPALAASSLTSGLMIEGELLQGNQTRAELRGINATWPWVYHFGKAGGAGQSAVPYFKAAGLTNGIATAGTYTIICATTL